MRFYISLGQTLSH